MQKKITVLLTNKNNLTIITHKNKNKIYIYGSNFYFLLTLTHDAEYFFEKYTGFLIIKFYKINTFLELFNVKLNNLLYGWNNFYFKKLKFTGKGYKIVKSVKKKNIKFLFNKAHFTFLAYKKLLIKRIKKTKFILQGANLKKLLKFSILSKNVRSINLYTLRGIRFSRSLIYKKASKKGVSL